MAENQPLFAYTNEQLDSLIATLSTDRLTPYLNAAGGDRLYAVRLYEWNTSLSESLYGVLQGLEVALRNSFHRVLATAFVRDDWYDVCGLEYDQQEDVRKAKGRIVRDGKVVVPCKVIAELTFGFWVSLVGPGYAQQIWDAHLHKAFVVPLGRKAVHRRLEKIRKLRNRVAHHESIIARNLKSDYARILEAVHWMCPNTAKWIKSNSTFHPRFAAKPSAQMQQPLPIVAAEEPLENH
jgi:hypothetical protein